jgi:hypothetical protein
LGCAPACALPERLLAPSLEHTENKPNTFHCRTRLPGSGRPSRQLIGVVEQPGQGLPLAFSNVDELWAILTAPVPAGPGPATDQ